MWTSCVLINCLSNMEYEVERFHKITQAKITHLKFNLFP